MKFSLRMSGETDVSATKIYNGWADKVARARANVATTHRKTRSFSFRVAGELDLSGIIKRIEGKRKKKERSVSFHFRSGEISCWLAKNPKLTARGLAVFLALVPSLSHRLLFTAAPNGSNENAVEGARFVESFALSWLRTRLE